MKIKLQIIITLTILLEGCNFDIDNKENKYYKHKNITTTTFWIGENATKENNYISNISSAWDEIWLYNYGGIDNKEKNFEELENSFYFALPFNDLDENGKQKKDIKKYIPWYKENFKEKSLLKNKWIKIEANNKVAYAQWEDVGPFGENDINYVFGKAKPKNKINNNAGLDVSPAVKKYLNLKDIDKTDWQFIDEKEVQEGPWKKIITKTNVIWTNWYKPDINVTWQWQLSDKINLDYNVLLYDIDLFDTTKKEIEELHKKNIKVICYFSAGSYEDWRIDKKNFLNIENLLGNELEGWEGERWLNIKKVKILKQIMKKRLELAKEKGCDGVEPDNVDGYINNTGFDLTYKDQIKYNKIISNEAHKLGLFIGLKNDMEQIKDLKNYYDFALNEQCNIYNECELLLPFINDNKPVLNAEYSEKYVKNENGEREEMCKNMKDLKIKTLILPELLNDKFRYECN